jgi:histidinol phosphatase-like PHP family hydrolase
MTGRQLLGRPGYEIDIEKVLTACADHGVAVEIKANPWRLDLDWRWHETVLRLGCLMSINPDARSTAKSTSPIGAQRRRAQGPCPACPRLSPRTT